MLATLGLLAGGRDVQRARAASGTPLLPNLVADPPDDMSLATDSSTGTTRLLLRFNGYVHNSGPGAVDFRGWREKPQVSRQVEEEVARAHERKEDLPQKVEEELAVPPMRVFQRLFRTEVGQEESNIERAHADEASDGEMVYVNADGHHHWHLQRVAKYSLWNASKTAEVAPAQKVGFCLEDSQHVEPDKGPSSPAYADNVPPYRAFCKQYEPNATSLFEGISPGWRDVYNRELALQWVDASDVLPGEYWLREDVNPLGVIKEAGGGEKTKLATTPTIIPGFDALPQALIDNEARPVPITLTSQAFGDTSTPQYTIVSGPQHGTLSGEPSAGHLLYTPAAGYKGTDSLTFSAADPSSRFPLHPALATVTVGVGPSISINGAQAQMVAGTSVQLTADVAGDPSGAALWEVSAGAIDPEGAAAQQASYKAPSQPGTVTITARLLDDPSVSASQIVTILPVPAPQPAPELPAAQAPSGSGTAGYRAEPGVSSPRAMWFGRYLVLSAVPSVAGKLRLTAYRGKHVLGSCVTLTPAYRTFTCRLTPRASISRRARIAVLASLRVGSHVYYRWLSPRRIPEMKMKPAGAAGKAAAAAGGSYWCSASTLVPSLEAGEG